MACVSASSSAGGPASLMRLEHLQAAHAYGLPLALLAADRLIQTGAGRHALWLACWMSVMIYTSGYLAIFATVALAVLVGVRLGEWRSRVPATVAGFTIAAILTAVVALPLYLPYRRVAQEQGMTHGLDGVAQYSAALDGYVASHSRVHGWLWDAAGSRVSPDAFFPGVVVSLLGLAAIAGAIGFRSRRAVVCALIVLAVVGCVLSLGTRTPIYGWLHGVFPPMTLTLTRAGPRSAAAFALVATVAALVPAHRATRIDLAIRGRRASAAAPSSGIITPF